MPLGVIGIIYESRPNVTADAGALCLKAGNACILRGGSESFHSSRAIVARLQGGLEAAGLPSTAIQLVPTTDRAAVGHLLRMEGLIDVIVPRGGRSLIERVQTESRVPVFAHLDGNCHVYLHRSADPDLALDVTLNAKLRRTGVCGAAESLLCDRDAAERLLRPVLAALIEAGCEVRGDPAVCALEPRAVPATHADWSTEYLDRIISAKLVSGLDEAIAHINRYGSHHTDSILAADRPAAERFLRRGRQRHRPAQCQHPVRRRRRVRHGGRGRHRHRPPARARAGRPGAAHHLQVHGPRHRPDPARLMPSAGELAAAGDRGAARALLDLDLELAREPARTGTAEVFQRRPAETALDGLDQQRVVDDGERAPVAVPCVQLIGGPEIALDPVAAEGERDLGALLLDLRTARPTPAATGPPGWRSAPRRP